LTEHDHASPAKPRPRHRELLAALVSGFVGAVALATSTYTVYLQRQQVRAQVWPYLVMGADWGHDGLVLDVVNRGVGPAAVKRVRVTVDGKPMEDWVLSFFIGVLSVTGTTARREPHRPVTRKR
jgi:hypothetical protein